MTGPFSRRELVSLTNPGHHDVEFLVLPGAGAGPSSFSPWCGVVPDNWRLTSVCLPGRSTRVAEDLPTDIRRVVDELTDAITSELGGPLVLFGHSLGGLLALEIAARVGPLAVFVAGTSPVTRMLHTIELSPDEVRDNVRAMIRSGVGGGVLDDDDALLDELLDVAAPILRADMLMLHGYRPPDILIDCDIHAYYGTEDIIPTLDWSRHTTGSAPVIHFPGNHYFPQRAASALVDDIVTRLAGVARPARVSES